MVVQNILDYLQVHSCLEKERGQTYAFDRMNLFQPHSVFEKKTSRPGKSSKV
jgi:hypothetical protein